jgi:hypothetical protein
MLCRHIPIRWQRWTRLAPTDKIEASRGSTEAATSRAPPSAARRPAFAPAHANLTLGACSASSAPPTSSLPSLQLRWNGLEGVRHHGVLQQRSVSDQSFVCVSCRVVSCRTSLELARSAIRRHTMMESKLIEQVEAGERQARSWVKEALDGTNDLTVVYSSPRDCLANASQRPHRQRHVAKIGLRSPSESLGYPAFRSGTRLCSL